MSDPKAVSDPKTKLARELARLEAKVKKQSDALFSMDMGSTTVRRRAMARAKLSITCEARDRIAATLRDMEEVAAC